MSRFINSIEYTNTDGNQVTLDSIANVSTVDASTLSVANAREAQHAVNADNATSATKADAIEQADTRSTNELPTFYYKKAEAGQNFVVEFKESAAIGLSGQSEYCQLHTYAKWTDITAGNLTQAAVVDTNYFIRTSTGSTGWGAWERLLKEGELASALLDMVYPVGSIYMSVNNVSPESFLGGTWVAWGAGRVPVSVGGGFNTVEQMGGSSSVYVNYRNLPPHKHNLYAYKTTGGNTLGLGASSTFTSCSTAERILQTEEAGYGEPISVLQPYITCYMWKRTK